MSISNLPNEIAVIVLSYLELEDQFRLSLTCLHFQHLFKEEYICWKSLQRERSHLPKLSGIRNLDPSKPSAKDPQLWRRLVKRIEAIQTASPFHFAILGTARQFILSNGALIYRPAGDDMRVLFLDGSCHEEIHVDSCRLAMAALPKQHPPRNADVIPLYHSDRIFSFLIPTIGNPYLVVCELHYQRIIKVLMVENQNNFFARHRNHILYYGYTIAIDSEVLGFERQWIIGACNLHTGQDICKEPLPPSFSGTMMGRDVCFEVIDGYLYCVSPAAAMPFEDTPRLPNSYYHIIRLKAVDDTSMQRQDLPKSFCWRKSGGKGSMDPRYSRLSIVADGQKHVVLIYEVRKQWTHLGYTERNCYRKEIHGSDFVSPEHLSSTDVASRPIEYSTAEELRNVHVGDNGLDIWKGVAETVHCHAYDTLTRSFVDLVSTGSSIDRDWENLRLRVRPMIPYNDDGPTRCRAVRGDALPQQPQYRFWPPQPILGQSHPETDSIRYLMNPTRGRIERVQWAFDSGYLVFSPSTAKGPQSSALILLSFDPGLPLHGLQKVYGSPAKPIPQEILDLPFQPDSTSVDWASPVQPFRNIYQSPECRGFGFDFTHETYL